MLLNLRHAYSNNDGSRVQVGGKGASKKAAIADAVFKTLQFLLTLGPEKVYLLPGNFTGIQTGGEFAIATIRAAASSARLKLFELLGDEGLFSFSEQMTPLLHLDPNQRWCPAIRNNPYKRLGYDASSETDDEKKLRVAFVVDFLFRFCQGSRDGKFRPHHPTAIERGFLITSVVPFTLKSIVEDHRVFEMHQEDGFRWSVSVRTLELPIARELETEMDTDITAIVPTGATSSQNHQAYMNLTLAVECVDACLTNVPEIAVLGSLLAAVLPPQFRRSALNHHTTSSWQPGRRGADVNSSDNPVPSLASVLLRKIAFGFMEALGLCL